MGSIPKVKKKNLPKSVNEMSKEMLQETLKKKKECNAKAQQTVEKLCEENIEEEWFLENLQYINQCHFDDITVERAITKICGYPLCDQKLGKIPSQQFRISTRYNKVFDITERKNFCSNCCYKSAMYVKNQLFTSPLWFRDQEVIPKYSVLKSDKSSMGEEIVFLSDKIKPEDEETKQKNLLDDKVNELEEKCSNLVLDDSKNFTVDLIETKIIESTNTSHNSNTEKVTEIKNSIESETPSSVSVQSKPKDSLNQNLEKNVTESKTVSFDTNQSEPKHNLISKKSGKVKEEPVNEVIKVEKCIFEWFSLDTLFYLYTEEKLKELFQEKAIRMKEILNSKLSMARRNENIDRMIRLYGLLDSSVFSRDESKTNLKPLPDYSILKEESKRLQIKVRAFYEGQLEIKPHEKEETKEEEIKTDSNPIYLPLVDAHAQNALRRKIILDKLSRMLPELILVFSTDYVLQMSEVRNLVTTFSLDAHNITFKPREWNLIGIILVKLLCIKDKYLEKILKLESSKEQLHVILKNYDLEENYLDDLVSRLTDGTKLVEKLNDK